MQQLIYESVSGVVMFVSLGCGPQIFPGEALHHDAASTPHVRGVARACVEDDFRGPAAKQEEVTEIGGASRRRRQSC